MKFTKETPIKKASNGSKAIQTIGFLGLIFCLVNLFAKFSLPVSAWAVFGVSLVLYVVGTVMASTLTLETEQEVETVSEN